MTEIIKTDAVSFTASYIGGSSETCHFKCTRIEIHQQEPTPYIGADGSSARTVRKTPIIVYLYDTPVTPGIEATAIQFIDENGKRREYVGRMASADTFLIQG